MKSNEKEKNHNKKSEWREMKKREEKRFHDPNPERWRRSHSRRVIISLHYFPPSLPSSSSSWRLSESLITSHTRAQHRHNNCTPFLDRHSTSRDFSDLKAQWKLCDIFTDHLKNMKSSSEPSASIFIINFTSSMTLTSSSSLSSLALTFLASWPCCFRHYRAICIPKKWE